MNVQFYIDHTQHNIPGKVGKKKRKKFSNSGGNRFYSESNERGVGQWRTMLGGGMDLNRLENSYNDFFPPFVVFSNDDFASFFFLFCLFYLLIFHDSRMF